ncbi:hypothetical protein F503_06915 [Ophiostoma piceae UAMH 11346]|uniref:Uncharacterized protein n=1 Tax=Ophiostoma piceae (strain UAMH 11346) TaxID=1262450 RepID=S3C6I2_OPHP1|nr:hypothetical protein F503_06915 [Ophiostoma piceae UAMH 11346]
MCILYYYYCYTGCAHTLSAYSVPSADQKIYQRCAASTSGSSLASVYSSSTSCSAGSTYYSPSTASLSTATCYKMCPDCEREKRSKAPSVASATTPSYNTSPSTISALLRDTTPPLNIDAWLSKTVGTTTTGSSSYAPASSSPLAAAASTPAPKRAAESTLTFKASKPPLKKR